MMELNDCLLCLSHDSLLLAGQPHDGQLDDVGAEQGSPGCDALRNHCAPCSGENPKHLAVDAVANLTFFRIGCARVDHPNGLVRLYTCPRILDFF